MNGMLINEAVHIGISIDEVLKEFPYYIENNYYEGGRFYSFPGGFSYFYDEITREITIIALAGRSVTNNLAELKQVLGQPIDSGYDEMENEEFKVFAIGEYTLRIGLSENGELSTVWYTKKM